MTDALCAAVALRDAETGAHLRRISAVTDVLLETAGALEAAAPAACKQEELGRREAAWPRLAAMEPGATAPVQFELLAKLFLQSAPGRSGSRTVDKNPRGRAVPCHILDSISWLSPPGRLP